MTALTALLLLSVSVTTFATRYDIPSLINCAKCASLKDDKYCDVPAKVFYTHPGFQAQCQGGCVHIDGVIQDPTNLNEEWKVELIHVARQRGWLPWTGSVPVGSNAKATDLDVLNGKRVALKLCGSELPPLPAFDYFGCRRHANVNGISGDVCRCIQNQCNIDYIGVLKNKIDDQTGYMKQGIKQPDFSHIGYPSFQAIYLG